MSPATICAVDVRPFLSATLTATIDAPGATPTGPVPPFPAMMSAIAVP